MRSLVLLLLGLALADEEPGVAASFSDFKEYMQRFGHSEHDLPSFQKYLKLMEFQKAAEDKHAPDHVLNYEDYSRYLQGNGGNAIKPQEFMDYQKYMNSHSQYQDFSKYLTNEGQAAPSYHEFLGFQHFTQGQQEPAAPEYKQYMNVKQYTSNGKVPEDFKQYAQYQQFLRNQGAHSQGAAMLAAQAKSKSEQPQREEPEREEQPEREERHSSQSSQDWHNYMDFKKFMDEYKSYQDWSKYTDGGKSGSMDFQQYMDFKKYMSQGQQGGSAQQQYMDYSKYVNGKGDKAMDFHQFMDFKKYMSSNGSQAPANFMGAAGGSAGNFEKYMTDYKQYMDWQQFMNYQKYMSGSQASGGDFSKYVPKSGSSSETSETAVVLAAEEKSDKKSKASEEQPSQSQGQGQGNFQQYIPDISQYIPGSGGSSGGSQYMDFSKYMGGGGSSGGSNYMDFSKYMGAQGGDSKTGSSSPSANNFQQYMNYQQYMGKYNRQDWMKFQQQQGQQQNVPYSASDCKTLDELKAWHQRQLDTVNSFIPEAFQSNVLSQINDDYETNKVRLGGSPDMKASSSDASASAPAPAAAAAAAPAPTGDDADPEVEKALAKARAALAQSNKVESPKALLEQETKSKAMLQPPLATELAASPQESQGSSHPWRAAGVVLLGLAMPAALAMLGMGTAGTACRAPSVSRRPSQESLGVQSYIELDGGEEV